jgi:hypothetical protein
VTLPTATALKTQITGHALGNLHGYLKSNRPFLKHHADFDEFIAGYIRAEEAADNPAATNADKSLFRDYKRASELLAKARSAFLKVLWRHEVYLSVGVIDRIIYGLACDNSVLDLCEAFFAFVMTQRLHQPGFVLYPIHSFGIQGFGVAGLLRIRTPDVDLRDAGVILIAQTNKQDDTLAFVERVRIAFGITQAIPIDFKFEFQREVLAWMTKNPLLAVRMASTTSGYYENQFIIMVKLRLATVLVQMLAALGRTDRVNPDAYNLSTARANNWQTLDIHHYIVFEASPRDGSELEVLRTPMNLSRAELASLSELNVDLDPVEWANPDKAPILERTAHAINELERSYLADWVLGNRRTTKARVLGKLFLSVSYFHRCFRSAQQEDEAVVAIAIAFETLLTDGYQRGGVKGRVARRVPLCLSAEPDAASLSSHVQKLMERRGNVVHEGASDIEVDLNAVRRAYVLCFLAVMARLSAVNEGASQPVGDILGDVSPTPTSGGG